MSRLYRFLVALCLLSPCLRAQAQSPLTSAFQYQGELGVAGVPADGIHDFRFRLFASEDGTDQVGPALCANDVGVAGGRFAVLLDFGAVFDGRRRWLEVSVRADSGRTCGDEADFVVLGPRNELTATPHGLFATLAVSALTADDAQRLAGRTPDYYLAAENLFGTLPQGVLPTNIPRLDTSNAFGSGTHVFDGPVGIGTNAPVGAFEVATAQGGEIVGAVSNRDVLSSGPILTFSPRQSVTLDRAGLVTHFEAVLSNSTFGAWAGGIVRDGDGTGPTLATLSLSPSAPLRVGINVARFVLSPPLPLTAGRIVTFELYSTFLGVTWARGNAYEGGREYSMSQPQDTDLAFTLYVTEPRTDRTSALRVTGEGVGVRSMAAQSLAVDAPSVSDLVSDGEATPSRSDFVSPQPTTVWQSFTPEADADLVEIVLPLRPYLNVPLTLTAEIHIGAGVGSGALGTSGPLQPINSGIPARFVFQPSVPIRGGQTYTIVLKRFGPGATTPGFEWLMGEPYEGGGSSVPGEDFAFSTRVRARTSVRVLATSAHGVDVTDLTAAGTVRSAAFEGDGSQITQLDASHIATGTLHDSRLSSNVSLLSAEQTITGAKTFTNASNAFTGSGAGLTGLNASGITTGTLSDSRLSSNVALLSTAQTFTGAKTFTNASNAFTGSGAGLTGLNASGITTGTLSDSRLSSNVALLSAAQTFTGAKTFTNASNAFTGSGAGLTGLNASGITTGTLSDSRLSSNVALLSAAQTFAGFNVFANPSNQFVGSAFVGGSFSGNGSGLTALNASNLASGTVPDARLASNLARRDAAVNSFSGTVYVHGDDGNSFASLLVERDTAGNATLPPLRVRVNNATKLVVDTNGGTVLGVNNTTAPPPNGLRVAGGSVLIGEVSIGSSSPQAVPANGLRVAGGATIIGTLSKGGGSFKIDHPLDPANKYLYHSFVESPDMMNIYNGNTTTDESGYAVITLPDWFEALNKDFRYQLTIIDRDDAGEFNWARVVKTVQANTFSIRTTLPRSEVSWQVTGIRKDAWAEKNRIPIEEAKPASERGTLLHPEAFGDSVPATRPD
ncbi:MAG: hypothetical protein JNK25_09190 [Phycisphaerae bacterium]|nr:hypothetical protein [Phycisphaerae bacterium]